MKLIDRKKTRKLGQQEQPRLANIVRITVKILLTYIFGSVLRGSRLPANSGCFTAYATALSFPLESGKLIHTVPGPVTFLFGVYGTSFFFTSLMLVIHFQLHFLQPWSPNHQ